MNYKERAKIIVGLGERGFPYGAIAQWVKMPNEGPVSRERIRQILVKELGVRAVKELRKRKKSRGSHYGNDAWEVVVCEKCGKKLLSPIHLNKKFCSRGCFKAYRNERADRRAIEMHEAVVGGASLLWASKRANISYTTAYRDYRHAVEELGMPELNLLQRYNDKRALVS